MNLKQIKKEVFYLRKAFFQYHAGFAYCKNRWVIAPQILKSKQVFEKPITNLDVSVHILTCHRDLIMSIWALASWYAVATQIGQLYVHNDGSLTTRDISYVKKFFPSAKVIDSRTIEQQFAAELEKYPVLRDARKRFNQFSFKKLVDPLVASSANRRLIIDSDIVWFKNPAQLESRLRSTESSATMMKNNSKLELTYALSQEERDRLGWVNAGIIAYQISDIDFRKLNDFIAALDSNNERQLHFAEQYGLGNSLRNLQLLDDSEYGIKDGFLDTTVVRHYTSPRRPLFYVEAIPKLKKNFEY